MALERIARVDEIPAGGTCFFARGDQPLILANVAGDIFALEGLCPHQHNPLEGATRREHLIDCPFHHYQYDVRSGVNYFPRNVYPRDLQYRVEVREGEVWVDL